VKAIEFPGCGGRNIKTGPTVDGAMNCTWNEVRVEIHLSATTRCIERTPVDAGLKGRAQGWSWSSVRAEAA